MLNDLNNKLSMLIHTCDKFSDLWDAHIYLLNKNWTNRNIDTFLVTDSETKRSFNNVNIISAGDNTELSQRTQKAIESIKTEYVLITLDDYFPIFDISSEKIARLIEIMDKENIDYIRLFSDPNSHKKYKQYKNIYQVPLDINYEVNLYQGIWRKSFIEKTIKKPLNAWQYEVSLTKIAREVNAKCLLSKGKEFEILDVVRKGKLLHKANRFLKKNNLYNGSREVISWKEEFRIFVFSTGKKILPKRISKCVKNILRKRGQNFYSDNI